MAAEPAPDRVHRFGRTERMLHWVHAAGFLVMLATGLISYLPTLATLVANRPLIKAIHLGAAAAWVVAIAVIVVLGDRRRLAADWREIETFDRDDRRWLRRRRAPQGRFNAGQKINAILTVAFAVLFVVTGALLWLGQRDHTFFLEGNGVVHVGLTLVSVVLLVGHLYLAVIHPRTRHALRGITTGEVDRAWAARHHPKWVAAEDARARGEADGEGAAEREPAGRRPAPALGDGGLPGSAPARLR